MFDEPRLVIEKAMRKTPYGHVGYSYERVDPRTGRRIRVTVGQKGVKPQEQPQVGPPPPPAGFENQAAVVSSATDRRNYAFRGNAEKVMARVPPDDAMYDVYAWLTKTPKFTRSDLEDHLALAGWGDKREREGAADEVIEHFTKYDDLSTQDIPYTEDELGGMGEKTQVTGMPEHLRPTPTDRDNWEERKQINAATLEAMPKDAVMRFLAPGHHYEYHRTMTGWHTLDMINGHESDVDSKDAAAHVSALSRAFGGQAFDVSIPGKVVKKPAPAVKLTKEQRKLPVTRRWNMHGFDDVVAAYHSIQDNSGSGDAMNADFVDGNASYVAWMRGGRKGPRPAAHQGGETDPFNEHLNLKGNKRVTGPLEALHQFLTHKHGAHGRFTWDDIQDFVDNQLSAVPSFEEAKLPSDIQNQMFERRVQKESKEYYEEQGMPMGEDNAFNKIMFGIDPTDGVTGKNTIDNDLGYATMGPDGLHEFLRQMGKEEINQFSEAYHAKAVRRNAALSTGEQSHPLPEGMPSYFSHAGGDALYELYHSLGGLADLSLKDHSKPVSPKTKAEFDALASHVKELREVLLPRFYGPEVAEDDLPF